MVYNNGESKINSDQGLVELDGQLGGAQGYTEVTCKEVTCTESLLTPGLQTSAVFQSRIYNNKPFKNWDNIKNQLLTINMKDGLGNEMSLSQRVFRMDGREFQPVNTGQIEEFTVHACDDSLLKDAKTLVSKQWKCTSPTEIVKYVLGSCVGAQNADVQSSEPSRDYVAEMIHPFQVVQQQANVALDGNDPSFVHFMTYGENDQWQPRHHFRSLKDLTSNSSKFTYLHAETAVRGKAGYNNPEYRRKGATKRLAIHFTFPCDFDLLSDLLNGVNEQGQNINSGSFMNILDMAAGFLTGSGSGQMTGCIQNGNFKQSLTNKGSAQQQNGCESDVEKHLLRRQARMGLLEKDKIAFRMIAPWNPYIHAGDVITFNWFDKENGGQLLYGSGDYLVASMTHRVQMGGYSTTTLDCVSKTVGQGIV